MFSPQLRPSRRQFLSAGCAAGAFLASSGVSQAANPPAVEAKNIQVVTDFCNLLPSGDMTKLASFFTDTVVYRLKEDAPPIVGRDAVLARIRRFFDGTDVVEVKILKSQAIGPVVMVDSLKMDHAFIELGNPTLVAMFAAIFVAWALSVTDRSVAAEAARAAFPAQALASEGLS